MDGEVSPVTANPQAVGLYGFRVRAGAGDERNLFTVPRQYSAVIAADGARSDDGYLSFRV